MTCNKLTKPDFTLEQIEECRQCKHASAKIKFCGLFKVHIIPHGEILQPGKNLILPQPPKPPTMLEMAASFTKAVAKWGTSGFSCVDRETYAKRKLKCAECTSRFRCPKCGCVIGLKIVLATEKCPENKW
jgi:hypothetical protein